MEFASLDENKCYDVALKLCKIAGEIINIAIHKEKNVELKSSARDLVTETDKAVENLVIQEIAKEFPSHKFIGEESVAAGIKNELTEEPTWIIDPVDGTMNFVHSFPHTCISLGFWVNKSPVFGIVYNPCLDQLYTARKGKGAFLNGKPIKVSGETDITKALIFTEMGTRPDPEKMDVVFKNFHTVMKYAHGIRFQGSAALDFCCVAAGYGEAFYHIGLHSWDMAAGALIVREAGGVVIDITGNEFDLLNRRVLCASSKEMADKLVSLLVIYDEERD